MRMTVGPLYHARRCQLPSGSTPNDSGGRASDYQAATPRRCLAGPVLPGQWFLRAGARPGELRVLTRSHLHLSNDPPFVMVWRSEPAGGDTKTKRSRRILTLPQRCVDVPMTFMNTGA